MKRHILFYNISAAYTAQELPSGKIQYKGAIFYSDENKPKYLGSFRFLLDNHSQLDECIRQKTYQFYEIEEEIKFQNADDYQINVLTHCIEHRLK